MSTAYSLPVILIISNDISKTSFFKKSYKGIYHLLERSDGKSGLELAKSTILDLVIIDSKIDDISIFELCREIRKIANYLETPILLMTNNLKKTFTQEALASGVSDFLNEPLDKDEIDQRLAIAFASIHRERRVFEATPKPVIPPPDDMGIIHDKAFKEFVKIRKSSELLSVLYVEVDNLKKMKETIAEEALLQLITVLQYNLRKYDILIPARPGKCIILLPKTSQRAAQVIADTIREAVKAIVFDVPLSVSIGLIALDKTSPGFATPQDFTRLIDRVEHAAEKAKKTGNTVIITSLEE